MQFRMYVHCLKSEWVEFMKFAEMVCGGRQLRIETPKNFIETERGQHAVLCVCFTCAVIVAQNIGAEKLVKRVVGHQGRLCMEQIFAVLVGLHFNHR